MLLEKYESVSPFQLPDCFVPFRLLSCPHCCHWVPYQLTSFARERINLSCTPLPYDNKLSTSPQAPGIITLVFNSCIIHSTWRKICSRRGLFEPVGNSASWCHSSFHSVHVEWYWRVIFNTYWRETYWLKYQMYFQQRALPWLTDN